MMLPESRTETRVTAVVLTCYIDGRKQFRLARLPQPELVRSAAPATRPWFDMTGASDIVDMPNIDLDALLSAVQHHRPH